MYLLFKNLHMTAAVVSIILFLVRFYWRVSSSSMMDKKLVKILPHVVDTVLLACAIALCVILSQYPFAVNWLSEKVILLVGYIFFGLFALKPAQKPQIRWGAFVLAMSCVLLIVSLAVSKSPYLLS